MYVIYPNPGMEGLTRHRLPCKRNLFELVAEYIMVLVAGAVKK